MILERGFLSNAEDADLLFDDSFLQMQAEAIAAAVSVYFGIPKVTPIAGQPELSAAEAVRWARGNGPMKGFRMLLMSTGYWGPGSYPT